MKGSRIGVTKFCKIFSKIFIVSFIAWFILNPRFTSSNALFALGIAMFSSFFFVMIAGHFVSEKLFDFLFKLGFYQYLIFMVKEITVSSFEVLCSVFSKAGYQGEIVTITIPDGAPMGKVLLVISSVILTPGTSVVAVHDRTLMIHCLLHSCTSIQNGEFVNKVLSFKF